MMWLYVRHAVACASLSLSLTRRWCAQVFKMVWKQFDPTGRKFIKSSEVLPLMQQLPPPLGLGGGSKFRDFIRKLAAMKLKRCFACCLPPAAAA